MTVNKSWRAKLDSAIERIARQEEITAALSTTVSASRNITFVQNLRTCAVHAMRAGDMVHTACGWHVGPIRQQRGTLRWMNTIEARIG